MSPGAYSEKAFLDSCGPDRSIQFVFGATSFYVKPSWLTGLSMVSLVKQFGAQCPAGPIDRSSNVDHALFFNHSILDLANVPPSLERPSFRLYVRKSIPAPGPQSQNTVPQTLQEA
jgi:hypothetical protein